MKVVVVKPVNHFKQFWLWIFTLGLSTPWWIKRTREYHKARRLC